MTEIQIEELKEILINGYINAVAESIEEKCFWEAFEFLNDNKGRLVKEYPKNSAKESLKNLEDSERKHQIYDAFLNYSPLCDIQKQKIEKSLEISRDDLEILRIGKIPTRFASLIISTYLAVLYGDLSDIPGFVRFRSLWMIDLDEAWHDGFLLPLRDGDKRIHSLRVFRQIGDSHPFILKKGKRKNAATRRD